MFTREGVPEDLETIFMMGFDTWHNGMSQRRYLNELMSSSKYPQGQWYVLENEGELVSSLIVYRQGFDLLPECWGVGSVATPPALRRRGYAEKMIRHVIGLARRAEVRGIYLFSGVGTGYYGKFGFECVEAAQPEGQAPCMVLAFRDAGALKGAVPGFF